MSIRLQTEVDALKERVATQANTIVEVAHDVAEMKEQVETLQKLLQAMTRASAKGGRGE